MKSLIVSTVLAAALAAGLAQTASAQTSMPVTQSNSDLDASGTVITGSGTYTFSTASDLLLDATATSSPAFNDDQTNWERDHAGSGGVPALTDGTYGGNPQRGTTATGGTQGGFSVTYNLGSGLLGGANPLGYQLSDIEVYSGWNDDGRYTQGYTVSYELVGSSTFTELSAVSQFPAANVASYQGAMTMLSPTSGQFLPIQGAVKAVKFDFTTPADPAGNNYVGYAELVVNGAVAPEPSTYALIGLGLAFLVLALRNRRLA